MSKESRRVLERLDKVRTGAATTDELLGYQDFMSSSAELLARQVEALEAERDHLVDVYSHWLKRGSPHGGCKECHLPDDHKIHL